MISHRAFCTWSAWPNEARSFDVSAWREVGRNEMDPPLCGSTSMSHNGWCINRVDHLYSLIRSPMGSVCPSTKLIHYTCRVSTGNQGLSDPQLMRTAVH